MAHVAMAVAGEEGLCVERGAACSRTRGAAALTPHVTILTITPESSLHLELYSYLRIRFVLSSSGQPRGQLAWEPCAHLINGTTEARTGSEAPPALQASPSAIGRPGGPSAPLPGPQEDTQARFEWAGPGIYVATCQRAVPLLRRRLPPHPSLGGTDLLVGVVTTS